MSELTDKVRDLLNNGKSADEIAQLMREKGIKGIPSAARRCPIAELLKSELGLQQVLVSGDRISLYSNELDEWGDRRLLERIYTEGEEWAGVPAFVQRFDSIAWPELVREESSDTDA